MASGGSLSGHRIDWSPNAALTTVLASEGYPGSYPKGRMIHIPEGLEGDDTILFHAGTQQGDGGLVTSGGRVLAVTSVAGTLEKAAARSRGAAEQIEFEGRQFRTDIGWRELSRSA